MDFRARQYQQAPTTQKPIPGNYLLTTHTELHLVPEDRRCSCCPILDDRGLTPSQRYILDHTPDCVPRDHRGIQGPYSQVVWQTFSSYLEGDDAHRLRLPTEETLLTFTYDFGDPKSYHPVLVFPTGQCWVVFPPAIIIGVGDALRTLVERTVGDDLDIDLLFEDPAADFGETALDRYQYNRDAITPDPTADLIAFHPSNDGQAERVQQSHHWISRSQRYLTLDPDVFGGW